VNDEFPTPEEAYAEFVESIKPDLEKLRAAIRHALKQGPGFGGAYEGPDPMVALAAYVVVRQELDRRGWRLDRISAGDGNATTLLLMPKLKDE
jgi:hypothetical protein